MIQNQYTLVAFNATSGTVTVGTTGNFTVHTVSFPKASAGIVRLANGDSSDNTIFPAASIGSMILDASFPNGLVIGADVAATSFTVTYQKP